MEVKSNELLTKLEEYYEKYTIIIWFAIILIPIAIITIGCIILPALFYDQFVWQYFWGPTVADAEERSYGDVTEGYNPVNTIVYGLILAAAVFGIYKIIRKFEHKVDLKFIIAIVPFIILGGTSRVMEDAEVFRAPVVYLFIAPIIYIVIGLATLGLFYIAVQLNEYSKRRSYKEGVTIILFIFLILNAIYFLIFQNFNSSFNYIPNPIAPLCFALGILAWIYYDSKKKGYVDVNSILFGFGLWAVLLTIFVLGQWQTIPEWTNAYNQAHYSAEAETQPFAFSLIILLAIMLTLFVYVIAKYFNTKFQFLKPYLLPINVALFFGHFLDAAATYIAIDFFNYAEKHVLPTFFIELFNTAAVMFVLKIIIIGLVIYIIDIKFRDDLKTSPNLVGLVKLCVFILGLAPGIRDVVRLGLGL